MKLIALMGAGLLAAGTMAAVPADAQRYGYGYSDGYHSGGYDRGYYRGDRGWRGDRHYRGWRGGRRYSDGPRYRGRGRVVCRMRPGYYGPVRTCFRVYR